MKQTKMKKKKKKKKKKTFHLRHSREIELDYLQVSLTATSVALSEQCTGYSLDQKSIQHGIKSYKVLNFSFFCLCVIVPSVHHCSQDCKFNENQRIDSHNIHIWESTSLIESYSNYNGCHQVWFSQTRMKSHLWFIK